MVKLPDLIEKEQEKQHLYHILEETPCENPEYWERHEDWYDAYKKAFDARTTLNWIVWGSYASWVFVALSVHTGKNTSEEDKDKKGEKQE